MTNKKDLQEQLEAIKEIVKAHTEVADKYVDAAEKPFSKGVSSMLYKKAIAEYNRALEISADIVEAIRQDSVSKNETFDEIQTEKERHGLHQSILYCYDCLMSSLEDESQKHYAKLIIEKIDNDVDMQMIEDVHDQFDVRCALFKAYKKLAEIDDAYRVAELLINDGIYEAIEKLYKEKYKENDQSGYMENYAKDYENLKLFKMNYDADCIRPIKKRKFKKDMIDTDESQDNSNGIEPVSELEIEQTESAPVEIQPEVEIIMAEHVSIEPQVTISNTPAETVSSYSIFKPPSIEASSQEEQFKHNLSRLVNSIFNHSANTKEAEKTIANVIYALALSAKNILSGIGDHDRTRTVRLVQFLYEQSLAICSSKTVHGLLKHLQMKYGDLLKHEDHPDFSSKRIEGYKANKKHNGTNEFVKNSINTYVRAFKTICHDNKDLFDKVANEMSIQLRKLSESHGMRIGIVSALIDTENALGRAGFQKKLT